MSRVSGSAAPPWARIASATFSTSCRLRAAKVTAAPASASAAATATPMPRPAPVTSARLPARRNDGVRGSVSRGSGSGRRPGVFDIASAVASDPDIGLLGMRQKALEHAKARAVPADERARLVREHLLVRASLDELADPEAAGVPRRLVGGQRVVGADHLVAVRDVRAGPQEQGAVVHHVVEEEIGIARHHLYVLGGDAVRLPDHFVVVLANDHGAVIVPGLPG